MFLDFDYCFYDRIEAVIKIAGLLAPYLSLKVINLISPITPQGAIAATIVNQAIDFVLFFS